ncbi:hypothetical protein CS006_07705 [Bifidobacterium primatium]|uniref:Triacylglycerol lipase n=2 Tax=Bifidobacterium TaxID=1678 RepID=A0A2M9H8H5_9BIFI|nr:MULTISPECIES: Mbeg1-like protein [Bifidobacterium]NEG96090.1 DUF2974 domain-containing protein [Bifidobacterium sp. SMB2]NEH10832.1 DUF2974 domain-containing protein [Bifidobacterium saimiriisciurei]PJM73110.1 hypothetical protein CS006_07705 [Bifidobacterium primatium]
MGNIVDYVRNEFRDFAELEFNEVDSLVFSELAYMHAPQVVPRYGRARSVDTVPITMLLRAEDYPRMFDTGSERLNASRADLLRAICESPRFRGLRVGEYVERYDVGEEMQFAAMTFDLGDCAGIGRARPARSPKGSAVGDAVMNGLLYVAFRGTDGTLVGWKEDFNMAFRCPVPAQRNAMAYLESIIDRSAGFPGGHAPAVMVGGHSKGGNMAVYAATGIVQSDLDGIGERARRLGLVPSPSAPVTGRSERIGAVFSHDGPGLPQSTADTAAFHAIAGRIHKTVPESSIIGMLLHTVNDYTVVISDETGIMQHMGLSWQVAEGARSGESGGFRTAETIGDPAAYIGRVVDAWLEAVPPERRRKVIDETYQIFAAAGYDRFSELAANWSTALPKILDAARGTDRETRTLLFDVLKTLSASAVRSLGA